MKKLFKITLTLFFVTIIVFGFALPVNMAGNWYQQFLPNIGSQQIRDIKFLDSLNGFAVTSRNINPDTSNILKTTNRGDTWQVVFTATPKRFSRIQFINSTTGFVCGGSGGGTAQFYKTTDAGLSWNLVSSFGCAFWNDMFVLNNDTIWLVDATNPCGGVFRTTNGGMNWTQQLNLGSQNPEKIYMFNARIGFMSANLGSQGYVRKTTDGGANWSLIVNNDYYLRIHFVDSLTGWRNSAFGFKKTTDGGSNWITQTIPSGGIIQTSFIGDFSVLNKDTLWGTGGFVMYPNNQTRGILYRTTNGGDNWLFSVPDTNINLTGFAFIRFKSRTHGWMYQTSGAGIHTTNGGGDTFFTPIKYLSEETPEDYWLSQNYPNPFNPSTVISYEVLTAGMINISVYDVRGRLKRVLINKKQSPGIYKINFTGNDLASGVYFYTMTVNDALIDTKKMIMIK